MCLYELVYLSIMLHKNFTLHSTSVGRDFTIDVGTRFSNESPNVHSSGKLPHTVHESRNYTQHMYLHLWNWIYEWRNIHAAPVISRMERLNYTKPRWGEKDVA